METKKVSIIRYRGSKGIKKVKELDILFPKVEEKYKEKSPVGGTLSLIGFALIMWLLYSEIKYYLDSKFIFKFSPDTDFDAKLKINVDLTVAMPCNYIGADILDSTNQNTFKFGSLDEEDTWFELAPNQRTHFDNKMNVNSYLREEFHAIQDLLWRSSYTTLFSDLPPPSQRPDRPYDACRIYGTLILNKVAGNFHITAGKSINLPRGHVHISAFMSDHDYNFTHRINRFSFGDPSPGIVHPLEGDERVTDNNMMLFQYFIEVVPTNVQTFMKSIKTFQYSVKELSRPIDHNKGSHGMPGIFFKYDMSALQITVSQQRDNLFTFLTRLCSIVGGVYVCSGLINSVIQFISNLVFCQWYKKSKSTPFQQNIVTNVQQTESVITKPPMPDIVPQS